MSKTNFKFKVGDRVRILDGSKISDYTGRWCSWSMTEKVGQEAIIRKSTDFFGKPAYLLEGSPLTWDERGLEPVKNECIVIYRKGQEVIALDKTTGKKAVAKCCPDDEFDFNIGSKLAFERLLGIEQPKEEKFLEAFEEGKLYVFRKEILKKCYQLSSIASWVEHCDGKVVDVIKKTLGKIDGLYIEPCWCEEIGYAKEK